MSLKKPSCRLKLIPDPYPLEKVGETADEGFCCSRTASPQGLGLSTVGEKEEPSLGGLAHVVSVEITRSETTKCFFRLL